MLFRRAFSLLAAAAFAIPLAGMASADCAPVSGHDDSHATMPRHGAMAPTVESASADCGDCGPAPGAPAPCGHADATCASMMSCGTTSPALAQASSPLATGTTGPQRFTLGQRPVGQARSPDTPPPRA